MKGKKINEKKVEEKKRKKKERKEKREKDVEYLPECMARTTTGMEWDNGTSHFMKILGYYHSMGFKTLIASILSTISHGSNVGMRHYAYNILNKVKHGTSSPI